MAVSTQGTTPSPESLADLPAGRLRIERTSPPQGEGGPGDDIGTGIKKHELRVSTTIGWSRTTEREEALIEVRTGIVT